MTPEARENQLMALATDLVEQRLRDGTASSQETTAIIKMCSTRARLEKEIMELQKDLVVAKTESYQSNKHLEELYDKAFKAMSLYNGREETVNEDD